MKIGEEADPPAEISKFGREDANTGLSHSYSMYICIFMPRLNICMIGCQPPGNNHECGRQETGTTWRCGAKFHMWHLYLVRISGASDTTLGKEKDNGNSQKMGV